MGDTFHSLLVSDKRRVSAASIMRNTTNKLLPVKPIALDTYVVMMPPDSSRDSFYRFAPK